MYERQKKRILVIDNDLDVCNMISIALEPKGFEVIIVPDPEKAIEKAKEIEPHLIFISLVLSRSNGLKVSTAILSIRRLKNVPILLLLSSLEEFNKRYATYLGIRDVLVKPLNTDKIVSETLKAIGEDTDIFERDGLSHVFSAEEKYEARSSEEKPNYLERTAAETLNARSDVGRTSAEKIVERREGYKDNQLYRRWVRGEHHFSSDREKRFRVNLLPYAAFLILIAVAILSFLFLDTNRNFLNSFFRISSEKKELVQLEKIAESISTEDKEAKKIVPPVTLDELNKMMPPPASADKEKKVVPPVTLDELNKMGSLPKSADKEKKVVPPATLDELHKMVPLPKRADKEKDVQERPLSVKKTKALKKKIYSVHMGAFLIEGNAVSLVNKFKQKGYEPFIRKVLRSDKKTLHRVLIGKFDNNNKASEQSKSINQKEGFNSFVYQYSL